MLLDLGFEGAALVLGGDEGEADARHDQQRDHESTEFHLKGTQAGTHLVRYPEIRQRRVQRPASGQGVMG